MMLVIVCCGVQYATIGEVKEIKVPHQESQKRNSDDTLPVGIVSNLLTSSNSKKLKVKKVKCTAYNATKGQCKKDPSKTAFMTRPVPGTVAISRDLEKMGLKCGSKVYIVGVGTLIVNDRMHSRKRQSMDILMTSLKQAKRFGCPELLAYWYE